MKKSTTQKTLGLAGTVLTVMGLGLLLAVGLFYVYSFIQESQLGRLEQNAAALPTIVRPTAKPVPSPVATLDPSATPAPPTPTPTPVPTQVPLPPRRITIPSIGVDARVVPIDTKWEDGILVWDTADHAVGYHEGLGIPGVPGNTVLSGHISSPLKGQGHVFRHLPEIKLGAEIILYTNSMVFRYQVVQTKVVTPDHSEVMDPTEDETLTLITCVPDWVYTHRLIVTAKVVSGEALVDEPPFDDSPNWLP